jgi:pimeloyl-ACP methyl ester carboxylesterase
MPGPDGSLLHGILHGGIGYSMVVQCQRLGADLDNSESQLLTQALARCRLPLLQLEFAGHGKSAGSFAATTYSAQVQQLDAALNYLGRRNAQTFVLFGAGMGGSVAYLAAARDERIVGVASMSAIGRPAAHLPLPPLASRLGPTFAVDAAAHDVVAAVRILRAPILVIHGDQDDQVSSQEAEDLASSASAASLELVFGADHLFSEPGQRRLAIRRAASFLDETARRAMVGGSYTAERR